MFYINMTADLIIMNFGFYTTNLHFISWFWNITIF